jgi:hypothetical protein
MGQKSDSDFTFEQLVENETYHDAIARINYNRGYTHGIQAAVDACQMMCNLGVKTAEDMKDLLTRWAEGPVRDWRLKRSEHPPRFTPGYIPRKKKGE